MFRYNTTTSPHCQYWWVKNIKVLQDRPCEENILSEFYGERIELRLKL